jgi:AcrR family transcriptional regulator
MFNNQYVRIVEDDRKTAAIIRDAAMGLFAERGVSGVTVREVAAAAGVSPGLVMHHFGSKDGLKEAVDRRAVRLVDAMLAELAGLGEEGGAMSLAALLADRLEGEPALAGYIRRLLVDGGWAAEELFDRLFDTTLVGLRSLVGAGAVRQPADERVRAAFLLVNDLAMVVFRRQIERVAGIDPLAGQGVSAWTAEVVDVYTNGLFDVPIVESEPPTRRGRGSRR